MNSLLKYKSAKLSKEKKKSDETYQWKTEMFIYRDRVLCPPTYASQAARLIFREHISCQRLPTAFRQMRMHALLPMKCPALLTTLSFTLYAQFLLTQPLCTILPQSENAPSSSFLGWLLLGFQDLVICCSS